MNRPRKKSAARLQRNGANESTSDSYSAAGAPASPDTSRSINDPFCWQNKKVLTHITETFAESDRAASARSVYLALSEVASDEQSDTFQVSKALIAHKAGVSIKTVQRSLGCCALTPGFCGVLITPEDLRAYLSALKVGLVAKYNHRRLIVAAV